MEKDTKEIMAMSLVECQADCIVVGLDGRVWPCCYQNTRHKESDKIAEYDKKYPNWNSIHHKSIDEIINHEVFQKHFNIDHFSDPEKVDPICLDICGVK